MLVGIHKYSRLWKC